MSKSILSAHIFRSQYLFIQQRNVWVWVAREQIKFFGGIILVFQEKYSYMYLKAMLKRCLPHTPLNCPLYYIIIWIYVCISVKFMQQINSAKNLQLGNRRRLAVCVECIKSWKKLRNKNAKKSLYLLLSYFICPLICIVIRLARKWQPIKFWRAWQWFRRALRVSRLNAHEIYAGELSILTRTSMHILPLLSAQIGTLAS